METIAIGSDLAFQSPLADSPSPDIRMNHRGQTHKVQQLLQRHDQLIEDLDRLNEQIERTLSSPEKPSIISSDRDAPTC